MFVLKVFCLGIYGKCHIRGSFYRIWESLFFCTITQFMVSGGNFQATYLLSQMTTNLMKIILIIHNCIIFFYLPVNCSWILGTFQETFEWFLLFVIFHFLSFPIWVSLTVYCAPTKCFHTTQVKCHSICILRQHLKPIDNRKSSYWQ